jgi:hypothetical protein
MSNIPVFKAKDIPPAPRKVLTNEKVGLFSIVEASE